MSELSDLVQDSLLATTFPGEGTNETIHVYHERSLQNRRQGARTERWVRRGRIGGGGFGIVWREERADDCDEVKDKSAIRAVKEIDLRGCTKRLFFNRELETIAKFSQRKYDLLGCFVKSYGWYQTAESLFIAMEYLELGDLQTYLSRDEQPPLAEYEAQDIAYQVLYGLREMHDNDFVHRDLKPGNILIASCPPNNWWVKLADFGISKRVGDGKDMPTTTKGTPGYMAPELQELTERGEPYTIDIWAAGEITFQLLTKTKTFPHAGALVRYIADIISFPFGSLQDAGVSDSCVEFILALMSPQPRDRPSAKEALETTWLKEALPIPDQLTGRTYCSPYVDNAVDSMTEEFASWNTVTAAQTETTIVLSKLESSAEPLDSMPVEAHFEHTRELMQPAPSMVSIKPPPGIPQLPPPPQSLPVKRFTESSKYNQAANAATLSQVGSSPSSFHSSSETQQGGTEQKKGPPNGLTMFNSRPCQDIGSQQYEIPEKSKIIRRLRRGLMAANYSKEPTTHLGPIVTEPQATLRTSSADSGASFLDHQQDAPTSNFAYSPSQRRWIKKPDVPSSSLEAEALIEHFEGSDPLPGPNESRLGAQSDSLISYFEGSNAAQEPEKASPYANFDDLRYVSKSEGAEWQAQNVNAAKIRGTELENRSVHSLGPNARLADISSDTSKIAVDDNRPRQRGRVYSAFKALMPKSPSAARSPDRTALYGISSEPQVSQALSKTPGSDSTPVSDFEVSFLEDLARSKAEHFQEEEMKRRKREAQWLRKINEKQQLLLAGEKQIAELAAQRARDDSHLAVSRSDPAHISRLK